MSQKKRNEDNDVAVPYVHGQRDQGQIGRGQARMRSGLDCVLVGGCTCNYGMSCYHFMTG